MSHAAGSQPRRADARRNVAAILAAATECLASDPDTSMAEIAAAAGVGRMTLYGHFKTRAELLDAVIAHAVAAAHTTLDAVDVSGDPRAALGRLVAASWLVVDQLRQVLAAAQRELPAERIHQAHDPVLGRVQALVEQGQAAGTFRTDLPLPWLVNLAMTVMHAAVAEVSAGRLASGQAPAVVAGTLLAALTAPGAAVPPPPDLRPALPRGRESLAIGLVPGTVPAATQSRHRTASGNDRAARKAPASVAARGPLPADARTQHLKLLTERVLLEYSLSYECSTDIAWAA